jgi:hypothetical protein
MQYQRDHCEHKQKVNQTSRDMEYSETANPGDQQDREQYRPYTHKSSSDSGTGSDEGGTVAVARALAWAGI